MHPDAQMQPLLMLPEILVFSAALTVLIGGSFVPRRRLWWTRIIAATALTGAAIISVVQLGGPDSTAFDGTFTVDTPTGVARVIVTIGTLLVVIVAGEEIGGSARESETYALLLSSATGVLILAGADDLLVLITGYLLASVPLYALIGMVRSPQGAEATMKAYLLGALCGILLLLGASILYGITGTTRYDELAVQLSGSPAALIAAGLVGVLAGLMFKAGGVPAHFWVPDAAQASNASIAMFLTTIPKIGALIAIYRLVTVLPDNVAWPLLIAIFAVASMTLGNLAAFWQNDPRRLLGWSTVSQVGYLLVPVTVIGRSDLALPSLLYYLAAYTVTNIAAFAVTSALPAWRELKDYRATARTHPWLAGALSVALLGLLGTPPTAVFVGKLTTASAAWDGGAAWLAIAVFINTLISLFYYLRWIAPTFTTVHTVDVNNRGPSVRHWSTGVAVIAATASLVLGIGAGVFWD